MQQYAKCYTPNVRNTLRSFRIKKLFVLPIVILAVLVLAACGGSAPAQGWSAGTVKDGTLFFGVSTPKVFAVDAANGTIKWQYLGEKDKPLVSVDSTAYRRKWQGLFRRGRRNFLCARFHNGFFETAI